MQYCEKIAKRSCRARHLTDKEDQEESTAYAKVYVNDLIKEVHNDKRQRNKIGRMPFPEVLGMKKFTDDAQMNSLHKE